MAFNELLLRSLPNAEKFELRRSIAEMKDLWNPSVTRFPTAAYLQKLNDVLSGSYGGNPDIPVWTKATWKDDSLLNPRTAIQQEFDAIVNNCDLSRLGCFIRTAEGQKVKSYLKASWNRVTLCVDSSIYSLFPGDFSLVCFSKQDLSFALTFGGEDESLQYKNALRLLQAQLIKMNHV